MQTIHLSRTDPDAFHSLQEAVLAIPDDRSEPVRILVSPGIYEEKVWIRKENLEIIGEQPENTIFRYGDGARKPRPDGSGEYGTFNTAVLLLAGQNIHVENLTVENTAGPGSIAGQALALYAAADRCSFRNCRFIGCRGCRRLLHEKADASGLFRTVICPDRTSCDPELF